MYLFNKLKPILRKLFFFPERILGNIIHQYYEYKNPFSNRYSDLLKTYKELGFDNDREIYIESLNKILRNLGYPIYDESQGMYSEHLIIFAAIANSNVLVKDILEIGTYDGKTAVILANLFPDALITTIDLKDDNPVFNRTYDRNKKLESFINYRNANISDYENINFIQKNSLELTKSEDFKKQDLIWVDGAHGYPIVSSDITNSIRLMKNDSILMCDDIWMKTNKNDNMYKSVAGFETLKNFSEANIIQNKFFRKRIGIYFNGNYKYVSFSKLINKSKY
tara:strand:+ start:64 stop:903 length:840 start_codon:yes stop_codon:yes gene_type:complete